MANPFDVEHDPHYDKEITAMIKGGEHGTWRKQGDVRIYTPHMSFFEKVPAHYLATYFVEHGANDLRLNLP
jgi:hypothetical protein